MAGLCTQLWHTKSIPRTSRTDSENPTQSINYASNDHSQHNEYFFSQSVLQTTQWYLIRLYGYSSTRAMPLLGLLYCQRLRPWATGQTAAYDVGTDISSRYYSGYPAVSVYHPFTNRVKTTQARITKSSPTDSRRTLVFGTKSSSRNSKGFTPSESIKWEWGRKIRNFQPISRRIS